MTLTQLIEAESDGLMVRREGAIVTLVLSRPDVGNALDLPLARRLMHVATACDEDASVRCVVLTGADRMFCAGGDVRAFAAAGDQIGAMLKEIAGYLHIALSRLSRMDKPLITAVNGPAAGAGVSLAILGDLAIAAERAHFTLAYTALGLSPDGASSWLLPRLIGLRRTQEIAFTNRRVGAQEAAAIGLVTRTVASDSLEEETRALASQLAAGPVRAFGRTRALLASSFDRGMEEHMEAEARAIARSGRDEGLEGIAAYVAKRNAVWPLA